MLNTQLVPATSNRVLRSLALRTQEAGDDAFATVPAQVDNNDEAKYADKCGTYTKGIQQLAVGLVDLAAYQTFKHALSTGSPADFEKIALGGPRTLNGPQGGLAFYLECLDASQFVVPPAPALDSEMYATELVELYWASLLRDVAFTDYLTDAVAAQAAAELSSLSHYAGPRDPATKHVTPNLLFRGPWPGETDGPYLSQFLLQTTALGSLPITQKYVTNVARGGMATADFMLDPAEFLQVQNGQSTGKTLTHVTTPVFLHDGRGLAAYTHEDVLYQAYFIAYLVLNSLKVPFNPGNPYNTSMTQNGFATLGQPDIAATLAAVAAEALKAVWYQKWWVHLRHRPESGGAIVHLQKTGHGTSILGHVSDTVLDFEGGAEQLRRQRQLPPVAGLPGRFTHPPGLSHRARHGGRGLHHRAEVLLRWELRTSCGEPCHAVDRRDEHRPVCGPDGRGAADGQRRTEQAGQQHQLRPRYPCRHSLAQRHRHVDPARRGVRAGLPAGSSPHLQRAVQHHTDQAGRYTGDDLQPVVRGGRSAPGGPTSPLFPGEPGKRLLCCRA